MRLYEVLRSRIWESEVQRAFRIVAVKLPEQSESATWSRRAKPDEEVAPKPSYINSKVVTSVRFK